jgi:hypothetical protein
VEGSISIGRCPFLLDDLPRLATGRMPVPGQEKLRLSRSRRAIIVREMLFNNDRAGPFPVAAFNIDMLLWVEGEQNSGREISSMLREAGFKNIDCAGSPSWIICSHLTPSRTLRIASRSLVRADSSRDRLRSAAGGIGTPGSAVGSIAEGTT